MLQHRCVCMTTPCEDANGSNSCGSSRVGALRADLVGPTHLRAILGARRAAKKKPTIVSSALNTQVRLEEKQGESLSRAAVAMPSCRNR